jgi:hypothetical protein
LQTSKKLNDFSYSWRLSTHNHRCSEICKRKLYFFNATFLFQGIVARLKWLKDLDLNILCSLEGTNPSEV